MNRKTIDTLLALISLAAVLLSACAAQPQSTASEPDGLTFIHMNDTYRIDAVEDGTKGGFGRVVTVVRRLQEQGKDVRLLHGGDFLYPSLESQLWNGQQMIDALNFLDDLAPLFVVIGNHEMDRRTPEHLVNAVRASRFEWLGDNYEFRTGAADVDMALRSLHVYEHAGRRVGFFALTVDPGEVGSQRAYVPVDTDYMGIARRSIEALETRGVDLIIGLTHLDLEDDLAIATLKQDHPAFAFIVGGHEHEPKYSAGGPDAAVVMKGASNARSIWKIDVSFDADSAPVVASRQLAMDESVAEDPDYRSLRDKWRGQLLALYPFLESAVGRASFPMDATEETIRNNETAWGNFIVDQMRIAFREPKADLAFINSGTLRIDDYVVDDITFEDIARTFGFSSFLRYLPITGGEFRTLMEAGYRETSGRSKGFFPQVSGFRVCVDRRLPPGNRIVSLQLPGAGGWAEIEDDRKYLLVMSDFLFRGNDGYELTPERMQTASRPGSELKYLVLDAIIRAQAQGQTVGEPVDPANPRYVALGTDRENCWPE